MNFLAFLFRMALRLALWLAALTGVLAILGVFLWFDMNRVYPDETRYLAAINQEASSVLYSPDGELDCDAVISALNRYAALGSGDALIAAAHLNDSGECGEIEGGDARMGMTINDFQLTEDGGLWERAMRYRNRLIYSTGLFGDRRFWLRRLALVRCENLYAAPPLHEVFEDGTVWSLGYTEIVQRAILYRYQCNQDFYQLGLEYINDPDPEIRRMAGSILQIAAWQGNANARWWRLRVLPTFDAESIGYIEFESAGMDIPPECEAVGDPYGDGDIVRDIAAYGQPDAIDEWMQRGPLQEPDAYGVCMMEGPGAASQEWRGGYDTPFWYAVTAVRSQNGTGLARLEDIGALIGPECQGRAQQLGEALGEISLPVLEPRPDIREMIIDSIDCQPEGLRSETDYHTGLADEAIGYFPPELALFPTFEPPFRRVGN